MREMKVHHGPLNDMAHSLARDAGIREMPYVGEDVGGMTRMSHALLPRSYRERGIATDGLRDGRGRPTPAFQAWVDRGVRHLARTQAWKDQAIPREDGLYPSWAAIAHPLTRLSRELNRCGNQGTMSCDRDMYVGGCGVVRTPVFITVASDGEGPTTTIVSTSAPDTVLASCGGRPLRDLVSLPTCGDAEIDADVAALTMVSAVLTGPGVTNATGGSLTTRIEIELEPAPWRALEPPPAGVVADWHLRHPLLA